MSLWPKDDLLKVWILWAIAVLILAAMFFATAIISDYLKSGNNAHTHTHVSGRY